MIETRYLRSNRRRNKDQNLAKVREAAKKSSTTCGPSTKEKEFFFDALKIKNLKKGLTGRTTSWGTLFFVASLRTFSKQQVRNSP